MAAGRRFRHSAKLYAGILLASAFFLVLAAERSDAHRPVTSKYDYNNDIFPLFRDHCASCHAEGGPAPMSLMTYRDAAPWAESIRDELIAGRMPPWPVDPASPPVKGGYPITAPDLDKIVVWASGGMPQGGAQAKLPLVTFQPQWKLGPPDLQIPMDVQHTVQASAVEETRDFSLPVNVTDTKWIRAADLMPGNAAVVRDAVISIENGPVLALWEPGDDPAAAPGGAAFRLAPGSKIHLQIHYQKHYDQEQKVVSDKSTVGLYFTDPPASGRELQSLAVEPGDSRGSSALAGALAGAAGEEIFSGALPGAARIVALRPMLDRAYESLDVNAIMPSGARVPLLRLQGPRPQWLRRYWLQEPVDLATGSKIEVRVTPLSDYSDEPKVAKRIPLQVALDYVPL